MNYYVIEKMESSGMLVVLKTENEEEFRLIGIVMKKSWLNH